MESMKMKISVCIGVFEIDDGELYGELLGDWMLIIFCKFDFDLCM